MKKSSIISLSIAILSLSIPLEAQAQQLRFRTSSYPGIHGSIMLPQSGNRGYNYQERNYPPQGNNYYSRERIIIERTHQGSCSQCSYPYQYNRGTRGYYYPNNFNYNNFDY